MRSLSASLFALIVSAALAAPAQAQTLGTFRWRLAPYGSVLALTVTQRGSVYELIGFEAQCGGNLSLPVNGVGVVQADGRVFLGLTSITVDGRGLHTRALINTSDFSGFWSDNAGNTSQPFEFNPPPTCQPPLGPRTGPSSPDQPPAADQQ